MEGVLEALDKLRDPVPGLGHRKPQSIPPPPDVTIQCEQRCQQGEPRKTGLGGHVELMGRGEQASIFLWEGA